MALLVKHEIVNIPVAYYGDSLEEVEDKATKGCLDYIKRGFIAELDTEGTEVRPGLFAWNVYIKNKTYR